MRIDLTENGDPIEVALSPAVGAALRSSGLVSAAPSLDAGWWTIGPNGKVGVARPDSCQLA